MRSGVVDTVDGYEDVGVDLDVFYPNPPGPGARTSTGEAKQAERS